MSRQSLIGAISSRASCNPDDGHYYSTYEALQREQEQFLGDIPATMGASDSSCAFIEPIISPRVRGSEFKFTIWTLFKYRLRRLRSVMKDEKRASFSRYFLYDGGLTELFVVCWLASSMPHLYFVFNFHWADQWNEIFDSTRPSGKVAKKIVKGLLLSRPQNLLYSAESHPLAEKLSKETGLRISIFPVFSTLAKETIKPWTSREVDVLILPQRHSELEFTFELSSRLASSSHRVKVGVRKEVFARWLKGAEPSDASQVVLLPLSQTEYSRLLGSSKIVVLPYDKPYFIWGSSGKFVDAIALGCFPLAPRGTAIPLQAMENPEHHEFDLLNISATFEKVETALKRGFVKLRPSNIEGFFRWISNLPIDKSVEKTKFSTPRMYLFAFTLTACQAFDQTISITLKGLKLFLRVFQRLTGGQ